MGKASKVSAAWELLVQPGILFKSHELDWNLNNNSAVAFNTLSVYNNTLCLDYNLSNYTVGVTPCYPSYQPATNRDPSQQWVWGDDAMVRPYANPSLCLQTNYPTGDPNMYLGACSIDSVEQHFAFGGATNMGAGSGAIEWGPLSLGIKALSK